DAPLDLAELVRVDRDPRAAMTDERRLLPRDRRELARRQGVVADRRLPFEAEHLVEPEPGGTRDDAGGHRAGADAHAKPKPALPGRRQLRRHDHTEARLGERRRPYAQEGERARRIELDRFGPRFGETLRDRRMKTRGAA